LLDPDRRAVRLAQEGGLSVRARLSPAELHYELAAADIVHFHFWNSPQLRELLEADWPPMRSLLWCHTNCREPPHILTRDLLDRVDFAFATTASTLNLLPFRNAPERVALAPGGADFTRLDGFSAKPHPDFTIGHVGTLDFVKLHPDFIAMSAAIAVPSARFVIAGDGRDRAKLERQAQCADRPERFQFCGYTEDIQPLLETFDVFGYPLADGNVTTAELILQEVMFAGIPAVVFPHGGAADLVVDNETGLIARDPTEYARMIEHLHAHPAERARLGENAAERARQRYGAHNTASKLNVAYRDLLSMPKRKRPYVSEPGPDGAEGARALVRSLASSGEDFRVSMTSADEESALAAEARIVGLATGLMTDIVLEYRYHYPYDPWLQLWAALVLTGRGHPALAASEFFRSLRHGCKHWRVFWYLAQAARQASSSAIADQALDEARSRVPRSERELIGDRRQH
jgi:glycosyltransferase involved in cell wall biosynthesis